MYHNSSKSFFNSSSSHSSFTYTVNENFVGFSLKSSSTSSINYDNVVVAGLTTAFKVKTSLLPTDPANFQGYWFEKAISVMNAGEAQNVYLEVNDETVILCANPLISFNGEIYYRFKEWRVYEREKEKKVEKVSFSSSYNFFVINHFSINT